MANRYEVEVLLSSGKDLKNINWRNGPIKPYAVLWTDPDRKVTSRTEEDSSPNWDQKLTVPVNGPIEDATLCIDVVHHASPDEDIEKPLIGSGKVKLGDIVDDAGIGSSVERTLKLKRPSGRPHGKLVVEITVREARYRSSDSYPPPQHASYRSSSYDQAPYASPYGSGGYGEQAVPYRGDSGGYGEQAVPYRSTSGGYGEPPAPYGNPAYGQPAPYAAAPYGQPAYGGGYEQAPPAEEKKSKFGGMGMGAGIAVGAAAGIVGGIALTKGYESMMDSIADSAADKVEERGLDDDEDDDDDDKDDDKDDDDDDDESDD